MSKDDLLKQLKSMPNSEVEEMMESKKTMTFSLTELIEISSGLGTYLNTPMGLITEIASEGGLMKLKRRIDSQINIRLGTYGIFLDDLEEE